MRFLSLAVTAAALGLSSAKGSQGNGGVNGGGGGNNNSADPTNVFPDDDPTQPGGPKGPPPNKKPHPRDQRAADFEDAMDGLQPGRSSNPNKGKPDQGDPSGRTPDAGTFKDGSGPSLQRVLVKFAKNKKNEGRKALKANAKLVTLDWSDEYGIMGAMVPPGACENMMRNNPSVVACDEDSSVSALGWADQDREDPSLSPEEKIRARHRALAESIPWGIKAVQAEDMWPLAPDDPSRKIRVCVADTGYGLGHPDLPGDGEVVPGEDAYGQRWDVDGHGHGTHCAGSIGAVGNNDEGVIGVFPDKSNVEFVVGKALSDGGSGSTSGVMDAVRDCVEKGARVVSMSLGCDECYNSVADEFYTDLYDTNGTLIIAAAGNSGNAAKSYPASYRAVVSVAALEEAPADDPKSWPLAYFSQVNDQVEVGGPGRSVESTVTRNGGATFDYATWSGTSMATPHVAAVAAMVWNFFPECTNVQIRNALALTAHHPAGHDACDEERGYGMVQAKDMYDLLSEFGCGGGGHNPDGHMIGGCNQTTTTMPPTISPMPTISHYPTPAPTFKPTPAPTVSNRPSHHPTVSLMPSVPPTNNPTYSPTSEARLKLEAPESDHFQIVPGFVFDIEAKENIVVHNLEYLLYTSTATTLEIYTADGPWLSVHDSPANWTLIASVPGLRGGGCLDYPQLLPRRSFEPIHIAAGTRKGFYFHLPDSSNQLLALDNRGFNQDGTYGRYHENNDAAVCDGVYKNNWDHHSGTPYDSFRYTGAVLYTIDGSRFPTASPTSGPTGLSPTASPTSGPTAAATSERTVIGTYPTTSSTVTAPGGMFDVVASPNGTGLVVHNFDVRIYQQGPPVTLEIFTKLGSHAEARNDAAPWTQIGTVADLWGSGSWPSNPPVKLPPGSFPPQDIEPGQTRAFYVRVQGGMDAENKLQFDYACSSYNQPYFTSDGGDHVCEGLWKRDWTDSSVDENGSGNPVGWQGSFYVTELGTREPTSVPTPSPTASPSGAPSSIPTATAVPSTSVPTGAPVEPTDPPTHVPTGRPSADPSAVPTGSPVTPAPTNGIERLATPSSNSFWLKKGVFFEVVAGDAAVVVDNLEVYSSSYSGRVKVWTKLGTCDDGTMTTGEGWEQIADTETSWSSGWSGGPKVPSWDFAPVVVPANTIRSFYLKSDSYLYLTGLPSGASPNTPWISNVAPVIPLTLCHGTGAGSNRWTTSGTVNFYGAVVYQELGPTAAPTFFPTPVPTISVHPSVSPTSFPSHVPTLSVQPSVSQAPSPEFSEERGVHAELCYPYCYGGRGNQFDLDAYRDMVITGLDIHSSTWSTKEVVVWMRRGDSYKTGGRHNNFDGGWELLFDGDVTGAGSSKLTALPPFDPPLEVSAGETVSFTVAYKEGTYMRYSYPRGTSHATPLSGSNDDMTVYEGSSVSDYYANNVATANGLSSSAYKWNGRVRYMVRNAGSSVPNPHAGAGVSSLSLPQEEDEMGASSIPDNSCEVCFGAECDGDDEDASAAEEEDGEEEEIVVNCDDETYAYVFDDGKDSVGCAWVAGDPPSRCGLCQATDAGVACAYERCPCTCAQSGA